MKIHTFAFCTLLLFLISNCANQHQLPKNTTLLEKELMAAIKRFNTAFKAGDVATLESMITDDYVHTNGTSSPIGKESWLNYLRKRKQDIEDGEFKVLKYTMSEEQAVFHGHTAIVTAKISVVNEKDKILDLQAYRVTNIWVYQDGSWKRAGFHDGKIK